METQEIELCNCGSREFTYVYCLFRVYLFHRRGIGAVEADVLLGIFFGAFRKLSQYANVYATYISFYLLLFV